MVVALALMAAAIPAAQTYAAGELCQQLEAQASAPYLVREADGHWYLLARRPPAESPRGSVASAKGQLAAHLAGGRELPVSWSGASWQGPFRCNGFRAILLTVPSATVELGKAPAGHEMNNQLSEN